MADRSMGRIVVGKIVASAFWAVLSLFSWTRLCATEEAHSEAQDLLQESFGLSASFTNEDRVYFLVRLCDISTDITPQSTEYWCNELLGSARKLPPNWNRVASEKNALIPLARVNPIEAFRRLSLVEPPILHPDGLSEDLRAEAATTIFVNYLRAVGPARIETIVQKADEIGSTGEYPYRAMGVIIEELAKNRADAMLTSRIFVRALNHFQRGSPFANENAEFFEFLSSAEDVIPESVFMPGLKVFVNHLTAHLNDKVQFRAQVYTVDGVIDVDNPNKLLLFRIFPTVSRFDRECAQELSNKYLWLRSSAIQSAAAAAPIQSPQSSIVASRTEEILTLKRISYLADSDPASALRDLNSLSNPLRTQILLAVAPLIAQRSSDQATLEYTELQDLVPALPEGMLELKGLVAQAKAAYYLNDIKQFSDNLLQAFDYALWIYESDSSASGSTIILRRRGAAEAMDLAEFAGQHMKDRILPRIRQVNDRKLRAYLLLYAAKGVGTQALPLRARP